MHINWRGIATACTLALTVALAVKAQANTVGQHQTSNDLFYNEPAAAPHGLRFSTLEARIATDPLTWSSDPGWQMHRTAQSQLIEATDIIRGRFPAGTSTADAATLLHQAGAHCGPAGNAQVVCQYRDAETPFGGEYFDNILWQVRLDTVDGHLSHVAVTRDWTRR